MRLFTILLLLSLFHNDVFPPLSDTLFHYSIIKMSLHFFSLTSSPLLYFSILNPLIYQIKYCIVRRLFNVFTLFSYYYIRSFFSLEREREKKRDFNSISRFNWFQRTFYRVAFVTEWSFSSSDNNNNNNYITSLTQWSLTSFYMVDICSHLCPHHNNNNNNKEASNQLNNKDGSQEETTINKVKILPKYRKFDKR